MQSNLSKINPHGTRTQLLASVVLSCRHMGPLLRAAIIDPFLRRARCRSGAWALMQLDDHLLRDIGLTRAELQAAAHGVLALGAAAEKAAGFRDRKPLARRVASAAAVSLALGAAPAAAGGDDFARLPTVADLPAGTVKVSPPIPGMGEHWANPKDLPLGPIYCVMHGKVVCAEFMVSQKDLANGRSFERLRFAIGARQPPINHLELNFQPRGHEGFPIPHYDLHMYFISPEARLGEQTATP